MFESFLSLGSNLGNRKQVIEKATSMIKHGVGQILKKSSLYETEPWGFHHPINFYNKVLLVKTSLNPEELLSRCLTIEKELGRIREKNKYEARSIDIDILFYDTIILDHEFLKIPHPYLHLRKFVLEPMNEIAPEFIHPVSNMSISELLRICADKTTVSKLER